MNSLNLIGRVAQDVEVKIVGEKGTKIINNSLAVVDKGDRNKTNFVPFTLMGKTAENFEKIVSKGDLISIENAELKVDRYKNKEGENRTRTYALSFFFTRLKGKSENEDSKSKVEDNPFANSSDQQYNNDDDLPF